MKVRQMVFSLVVAAAMVPAAFAQTAAEKQQLADKVFDYSIGSYWRGYNVSKLMDFKVPRVIWTKMMDENDWGIKTTANMSQAMADFAKSKGLADLEGTESANNNDRKANAPQVEKLVDGLKDKISFTLLAETVKGTPMEWDLIHRYMSTVAETIGSPDFKPASGNALVTLEVKPSVQDVTVVANSDGKHFTISAPSTVEASEWDSKIKKGLERAPSAAR